ncbi:hypothetical protein [Paenibacillus sp. FSL L8-0463]|uniref:hypothetical protein n=1 Tax=Paenibacillus sp. FSL L8-0463 TaxID=2954687 RepID=UPI0031194AEE
MSNAQQALKRFFEEKELEDRAFAVEHKDFVHMVESDFLKDIIVNHTPTIEQKQIWTLITMIDFKDGDINHFLEHLATGYIRTNF